MKHLGDITKIKGCNATVVDCIIGGSPCQDLSVAGKRAGLAGERSGLYMEQIRIIKEMRYKDEQSGRTGESIRPRYMVWENVPGAFSSNGGKDFAAVIEEAIKVVEQEAPSVPVPEKGWPTSGCIMGDNWSVAWRVLDAQFWGVPQRRRRIALVADFGGQSAPEILFVRKGVSRDLDESEPQRKATAGDVKNCSGADDRSGVPYTLKIRSGCMGGGKGALIQTDKSATLSTLQDQTLFQPVSVENHPADSRVDIDDSGKVQTLTSRMGTGGGNVTMVMEPVIGIDQQGGKGGANYSVDVSPPILSDSHGTPHAVAYTLEPGIAAREGGHIYEGVSGTLRAKAGDNQMAVAYGIQGSMIGRADHNGPQGDGINEDVSFTLNTTDSHAVAYNIGSYHSNAWKSDNPHSGVYEADKSKTLDAINCGYPGCNQGGTAVVQPMCGGFCPETGGNDPSRSIAFQEELSPTLRTGAPPAVCCCETFHCTTEDEIAQPLKARDYKDPLVIAYEEDPMAHGVDCRNATEYEEQTGALQSSACHNMNSNNVVRVRYIVRRLSPLECERLQGFPENWTNIGEWVDSKGKKHKDADSPRYKALGNSIALPPWKWVLKRLCACYERDATMASLFSGIGGFDLIWTQLNGWGSVLWEAEIEDFPSAVCRRHFGDEETGEKGDLYEVLFGRNKTENV